MDFNVTASSRRGNAKSDSGSKSGGLLALSFYRHPPTEELAIEDLEDWALCRLRVLKTIEELWAKGRKGDEFELEVERVLRQTGLTLLPSDSSALLKDRTSHFLLRLAYCRTEELRRWLIAQECSLFRYRFRLEPADAQRRFLEENNLPYRAIGKEEYEKVKDKLEQVARSTGQPVSESHFYKVRFEEIAELVAGKRVFLHKGLAYVPRDQLASIILGHFRANLSKALVMTCRKWTNHIASEEATRVAPLLEAISSRSIGGKVPQMPPGDVSLDKLDMLAAHSFPPCMRNLFSKLREEHHLKYNGRLQLGLFLKGIGLRLEDAMAFWRSELPLKVGMDKFEKEYAYSIRHIYGKEGKRLAKSPYSCVKIITGPPPGVGEHHGCPFRHFSLERLRAYLSLLGVKGVAMDNVMEKAKQQHYQLACAKVFEATHWGQECEAGVQHPNEFFLQSQSLRMGSSTEAPHSQPGPGVVGVQPSGEQHEGGSLGIGYSYTL